MRSFIKHVIYSLLLLCLFSYNAEARHIRDTLRFRKVVAEKHALVLTDSVLNEIGVDSILNKVEKVHYTLNRIINATSVGFNTRDIEDNLPEVDSNIEIIDNNLSIYSNVLDVKNLQMFDLLLSNMQKQVVEWQGTLFAYEKELSAMANEMGAFKHDTLLRTIIADSAFKSLYGNEIQDLKSKWKIAKKSISDDLSRMNQLQASVSNEYFTTIDLQNKSKDLLKKVSVRSLGKEYDYLWMANNRSAAEKEEARQLTHKSYQGQRKILHYYFRRNAGNQLWMLATGLLFLLWILRNFIKLDKSSAEVRTHSFRFIKKVSILATLVLLFNISTVFDLHPPTAYVALSEFLLVITLTIMLWRVWPRKLYHYWLFIGGFYIVLSFLGPLLTPDLDLRLVLLLLNIISLVFSVLWFRVLRNNTLIFSLMIKTVSVIYTLLNAAAIICNLWGRLSLAKIFSVTAIYGLTQIIGLTVFIQIVMEAFSLQTMVNKLKGGMAAKLDFAKMEGLLMKALVVFSISIWTIVFTISLNMYNFLYTWVLELLTKERKIGSTTFQVGNILLFMAIVYVSNLLQRGVGSLYGKSDTTWDPEVKKNGSRLAMTRLILIIIGFLIAIAASGIPMDKITIVLGALGVGIGLGLQGIVNNLVSGVILIFEQPFRIGDFIEIGDKKGRVLDIGIRASKIVMEEGAEIIMPNADLLSGRVINWTLRNDDVRIEMPVSVLPGHKFEEVKAIIIGGLEKSEHVIMIPPPEILLLSVTDKAMSMNVIVWINDVHRLQPIKSELLNNIYSALAMNEIKIA